MPSPYWSSPTFGTREIVTDGSHNFLSFPLTGGARSWTAPADDAARGHGNVALSSRYGAVAVASSGRAVSLFRQDDLLQPDVNADTDTELAPALPGASQAVWSADPGFAGPYVLGVSDGLRPAVAVANRNTGTIVVLDGANGGAVVAGPYSAGGSVRQLAWHNETLAVLLSAPGRCLHMLNGRDLSLLAKIENVACLSWHPDRARPEFVAALAQTSELVYYEVASHGAALQLKDRRPAPDPTDDNITEEDYDG